jgi:high-affinity nickel permease
MKTEIIAIYHTRTGIVAFEVKRHLLASGLVSYSYSGKHGAGCGKLEDIAKAIRCTMQSRKGIKLVCGNDITLYN